MFFCDDVSLIEFKSLYASRLYLSGIVITSGSKSELIALLCNSLVCRMCALCRALPLGVILGFVL